VVVALLVEGTSVKGTTVKTLVLDSVVSVGEDDVLDAEGDEGRDNGDGGTDDEEDLHGVRLRVRRKSQSLCEEEKGRKRETHVGLDDALVSSGVADLVGGSSVDRTVDTGDLGAVQDAGKVLLELSGHVLAPDGGSDGSSNGVTDLGEEEDEGGNGGDVLHTTK
jgi:hypothetical protein